MSGELIKAVAIVIIMAVIILSLRPHLQEYSFLLVIAVVCVLLLTVFGNLLGSILKLRELFNQSGNINTYFSTALKALGIAYITGFACDVCTDFGLSALAKVAEIAGKGAVFVLSVPLVVAVMEAALKFVGL